jgi:ferrous iron transport protein B
MAMGLGCNAAGVVATRVIDSPRERLIAILTNNFVRCATAAGPRQILMATVFLGALAPPGWGGLLATAAVVGVTLLGFALALLSSWLLARTVLRGEASTSFSLELPPFRPPSFCAPSTPRSSTAPCSCSGARSSSPCRPAPSSGWSPTSRGATPPSPHALVGALDPLGWWLGLGGVILLAYIVAIPANEIVIPAILMLTVLVTGQNDLGAGAGVMFEADSSGIHAILAGAGWTALTATCLMIFSLCHNPCSTTLYTIKKETGSWRWTALAAFMPLAIGSLICATVAAVLPQNLWVKFMY